MELITIINTTVEDRTTADRIAQVLLENKLAACIHISEIVSHYSWRKRLVVENEISLKIKTLAPFRQEAIACLTREHSYETPMILCHTAQVNEGYYKWMVNLLSIH